MVHEDSSTEATMISPATVEFHKGSIEGVVPFYLDHAHVKGRLIRLGPLVETLLANHQYPDVVNQYIAELIALAAALSNMMVFLPYRFQHNLITKDPSAL